MSVIDDAFSATVASTTTGSAPEDDNPPAISDEFHALLTELAVRRSASRSTAHSLYGQIGESINDISSNLEGFFSPEENLSSKLNQTARFFSSSSRSRSQFLSSLSTLSNANPAAAAGMVKDLFALQSSLTQALQRSAGRTSRLVFAQINYFKLLIQGQLGSASGSFAAGSSSGAAGMSGSFDSGSSGTYGGSLSSGARFARLSLQISLQEIMTSTARSSGSTGSSLFDFALTVQGSYVQTDMMLQALDPLVLDLDGNGVDLSPVEDGVVFDLVGNGSEVRCGFVQGDDALLFLDQNGDGVCTSGTELFGDQEGDANGFAKLSRYDRNGDGSIDRDDSVYDQLKVWNDWDGDGDCDEGEVRSLATAGVAEIGVNYRNLSGVRSGGNEIAQAGFFRTLAGELRTAVDAKFNYLGA